MARFYVEKDGEWNIFSTVVDDFLLDEFVCLDALKARLLYERYKELTEDIDSLLTDRPNVNVMTYEEAVERIRKTENSSEKPNNSTISKMEQVDEPQTCDTCKWGEWYRKGYDITMMSDECGGCCSWNNKWKPKDEPHDMSNSMVCGLAKGQDGKERVMIRYDHYTDKFVKVSDRECPWCKAVCASTDKYCHECGWHIADTPQTDCPWK